MNAVVLVSVVIPCFNVRAYVGATLDSLLAQDEPAWEALVIDDGSTDGTSDHVARYCDGRIRLIRQANQGVSAARNRGLAEARGASLLFLDGDDWLAPDALSRLLRSLRGHPNAVAAYGAFCFVAEDAASTPPVQVVRCKTGPFPEGDIIERLLVENLFANGGHLLIRANAAASLGGFRSDLRFGEDWEYWCRLALGGDIAVVPGSTPLLYVRQRSSGAYLRMATDPDSFLPCTEAIFGNPELRRRFTPPRLSRLRARTLAENGWIVGREAIRHGKVAEGRHSLRRSWLQNPSAKRAALLAIAYCLPLLPSRWIGPFRPYGGQ
ncbi:glycosyltransferase family 2 protein [Lichenicoccus sp.]|uniref:glycosyltransferase family 2 protein n=1 Tax=Lichenicoccus sp. TaxID=2781899 RepID=UPI003D0F4B31